MTPYVSLRIVCRHGCGLEWTVAQSGRQHHGDVSQLAETSVADQFTSEPEARVAALLRSSLENALCLLRRGNQAFAFVDGQGERLFAVDILARLERGQVDERVPVIGRAIDDGVNIFAFEELPEISVDLRRVELL